MGRVLAEDAGVELATIEGEPAMTDREQRIRQRAFELWERAGRPPGREAEHWREAERAIREEEARTGLAEPPAAYREEMPEVDQGLPDEPARTVKGEKAAGAAKGTGKGTGRRRRAGAASAG
jgi:hypothetical protein